MTRWTGARMATNARSDEDAAMAYQRLDYTFPTRDEARTALLEMLALELRNMATEYADSMITTRLARILADLVLNPTHDQAEYGGLRFSIWSLP